MSINESSDDKAFFINSVSSEFERFSIVKSSNNAFNNKHLLDSLFDPVIIK